MLKSEATYGRKSDNPVMLSAAGSSEGQPGGVEASLPTSRSH